MNEKQTLQRKIKLKGQALKIIRVEREEFRRRLFLLELRDFYICQIKDHFDQELSRKIDATNVLLGVA